MTDYLYYLYAGLNHNPRPRYQVFLVFLGDLKLPGDLIAANCLLEGF